MAEEADASCLFGRCYVSKRGNVAKIKPIIPGKKDGLSVWWWNEPTPEDRKEFDSWVESLLNVDTTSTDNGKTSDPGFKQREIESYFRMRKEAGLE